MARTSPVCLFYNVVEVKITRLIGSVTAD